MMTDGGQRRRLARLTTQHNNTTQTQTPQTSRKSTAPQQARKRCSAPKAAANCCATRSKLLSALLSSAISEPDSAEVSTAGMISAACGAARSRWGRERGERRVFFGGARWDVPAGSAQLAQPSSCRANKRPAKKLLLESSRPKQQLNARLERAESRVCARSLNQGSVCGCV